MAAKGPRENITFKLLGLLAGLKSAFFGSSPFLNNLSLLRVLSFTIHT